MQLDEYNNLPVDNQGRTKLFVQYHNMLGRCYNPNNAKYHVYGARGVTVCEEWRYSFENYKFWALANGYEDGLEIDKDKLSSHLKVPIYSPDTCCFLTRKDNMALQIEDRRNSSNKIILKLDIKTRKILAEYRTYNEATIDTNIASANISQVCRGLRKTAGGYLWQLK